MIVVRPLAPEELVVADARLPLHRLDVGGLYLLAWEGEEPLGHAHVEWTEPPEIQDVWVLPERRGEGIGTALTRAAEREAASRGHDRIEITVSVRNPGARRLYERLGYTQKSEPYPVTGPIMIRGEPVEVDDVLVRLAKPLVTERE
jgi:ribosomal protein S18 acetylase RimI-like enzyme